MLFVTVGTHEQQFNRLVEYMDRWAATHDEEVFIQTGFSSYEPSNCQWSKLIPFQDMEKKITEARIVITHGGPSSFIAPLQKNKIPIVIPRRNEFGEHVNNHQVEFCNAVAERQGNILVVNEIETLGDIIDNYSDIISKMPNEMKSNNAHFMKEFNLIIEDLLYQQVG